jgi:hypothetical protein
MPPLGARRAHFDRQCQNPLDLVACKPLDVEQVPP